MARLPLCSTALLTLLSAPLAHAQSFDTDSRMTELNQMQQDNALTFGLARTTVEIYGYFKVDFIKDFGASSSVVLNSPAPKGV